MNTFLIKRIKGFIIDFFMVTIVLFLTGIVFFFKCINPNSVDMQMASFVLISSMVVPIDTVFRLITMPEVYGNTLVYWIMICILFIAEVLYYTVQEVFCFCTIGKKIAGIHLVAHGTMELSVQQIVLRNILKVISRYLLYIPYVFVFFSSTKRIWYDIISNIEVLED